MSRLTPGWTKTQTQTVFAVACAVFAGSVGSWSDANWLSYAIPAAALLTFTIGLAFEPFVAFVTGIAAAAGIIVMKQVAGVWTTGEFAVSFLQIVLLILTGGLAGVVGRHLRAHAPRGDVLTEPEETYPEYGSLGLLRSDMGEVRLTEEIDRARGYQRPLSVLRISTRIDRSREITPAQEEGIRRAVARVVESLLRVTDVPFAYGADCIVAVLPETDEEGSRLLVRRVGEALRDATFVVRPSGTRMCISNFALVRFGTAHFPLDGESAHDLLESTQEALQEYEAAPPARSGDGRSPIAEPGEAERRAPPIAPQSSPDERRHADADRARPERVA